MSLCIRVQSIKCKQSPMIVTSQTKTRVSTGLSNCRETDDSTDNRSTTKTSQRELQQKRSCYKRSLLFLPPLLQRVRHSNLIFTVTESIRRAFIGLSTAAKSEPHIAILFATNKTKNNPATYCTFCNLSNGHKPLGFTRGRCGNGASPDPRRALNRRCQLFNARPTY